MGVQDNPPPCHFFSSSSPLPLPGFHLTTRSSLTDLEPRMSTSIRTCEPLSVMIAWKSQFRAMEEPRSISPTGWADSQEMALFGRTWFPSGLQTTNSTSRQTHVKPCDLLPQVGCL